MFWESQKSSMPVMFREADRILPAQLHSMAVESTFRYMKLAEGNMQIRMAAEQHFLRTSMVNGRL